MTLGIILKSVSEEGFSYARSKGLDFVEFCINGGNDEGELLEHIDDVKSWMAKYSLAVGSIGRWKTHILLPDGSVDEGELSLAKRLMAAADSLRCPNYICGCNYVDMLGLMENVERAAVFFAQLLKSRPESVAISTYNCRKTNFVCTPEIWSLVHGRLPELGIKYDPSHAIRDGKDYLREIYEWGNRIRHVHLKGSLVIDGQRVDDPPAGLDQTDWPVFLSLLRAKGYNGGLSIEPHSQTWCGELGERGVDYTIDYFRKLML